MNKGFPENWLYELKQRNNIVSVIEKYIRLDKKGSKYWACCPFHSEDKPSFVVNEDGGFYHCFGCKESGDVISFVMKYESCDFLEAIEILAKNANMKVPEYTGDKEVFEKKGQKDRIIKLLDLTYKHYQDNLYLKVAKPAQDYIKSRGFTKSDLDKFKLGYSLGWTEIIDYLKKEGFTIEEMVQAGVIQSKNNKNYDIYSKRLVFPIFNSFNECIGFSARVLDNSLPKYINTAETLVFHKGRVVFGINLVKELKQQGGLDKIIIVEGQIDVIAMHRAGFKSAVACMGTALTKENAHELKRLSNNVVLCFDGDTAGIKATIKSIDILKEEGFNIKIVSLPDKHDPDEIMKLYGKDYLVNLIDNALPITDFLINNELKNYDLKSADEKGRFTTAVLSHIAKIGKDSEEDPYLEKVRDLTNIPIDILRRDLDKIKNKSQTKKNDETSQQKVLITRENGNIRAVKYVIGSLIHNREFINQNIDYKKLLPRYQDIILKWEDKIPISSYFDYFDVENYPVLKDCIEMDFDREYKDGGKKYFDECVWSIASQELKNKQKELNDKIKNCEDLDERKEYTKQMLYLLNAINEKNLEDFYVRHK